MYIRRISNFARKRRKGKRKWKFWKRMANESFLKKNIKKKLKIFFLIDWLLYIIISMIFVKMSFTVEQQCQSQLPATTARIDSLHNRHDRRHTTYLLRDLKLARAVNSNTGAQSPRGRGNIATAPSRQKKKQGGGNLTDMVPLV